MLPQVKQDIPILDLMIRLTNRFKLEISGSFKRLHAFSWHNGGSRYVAVRRRPIHFCLRICVPYREDDSMQFAVTNNDLWCSTDFQGAPTQ